MNGVAICAEQELEEGGCPDTTPPPPEYEKLFN